MGIKTYNACFINILLQRVKFPMPFGNWDQGRREDWMALDMDIKWNN